MQVRARSRFRGFAATAVTARVLNRLEWWGEAHLPRALAVGAILPLPDQLRHSSLLPEDFEAGREPDGTPKGWPSGPEVTRGQRSPELGLLDPGPRAFQRRSERRPIARSVPLGTALQASWGQVPRSFRPVGRELERPFCCEAGFALSWKFAGLPQLALVLQPLAGPRCG